MEENKKDNENLVYDPDAEEKEYLCKLYRRKEELDQHWLPYINKWIQNSEDYENNQKIVEKGQLPITNQPEEIKVVETRVSDEIKNVPEVYLEPKDEKDRVKVEALNDIIASVDLKNKEPLLKLKQFHRKGIYGAYAKMIYWKETYRNIKVIESIEKKEGEETEKSPYIPKMKFKKVKRVDYKDIKYELVPLYMLRFNENSESMDDVYEAFYYQILTYEQAEQEFGMFENFKYVKKRKVTDVVYQYFLSFQSNGVQFNQDLESDCIVVKHWNEPLDQYDIAINGVLLTQPENPIPYIFWKKIPVALGQGRYMPDRLFPKSDVDIIKPHKLMKNVLSNAGQKAAFTNAQSPITATPAVQQALENGDWQTANIIPVSDFEEARTIQPVRMQSDLSGISAYEDKIDNNITTAVGVDTRAILQIKDETATKTAARTESGLKKIAMGMKLIEFDALVRETEIKIALIKQFYADKVGFVKDEAKDKENLGPEDVIEQNRKVDVRGKRYKWVAKTTEDGEIEYELQVEKSQDLVGGIEIRPELFDADYAINIRPSTSQPFGELYEQEKAKVVFETSLRSQNINQEAALRRYFKSMKIDPDEENLVIPNEVLNQMLQQAEAQKQQEEQAAKQTEIPEQQAQEMIQAAPTEAQ